MTDEEIIQKLKKSAELDCNHCWQKGENCDGDECEKIIATKILALINRQQTEIERLQAEIKGFNNFLAETDCSLKEIKDNAIKEFAERLRNKVRLPVGSTRYDGLVYVGDIDEIMFEMVGGENA